MSDSLFFCFFLERQPMQNNFWNENLFASAAQILCPDGGIICINRDFYHLNMRVPLDDGYET